MFQVNCATYAVTFVVLCLIHSQTQDNTKTRLCQPIRIVVSTARK